MENTSLRIQFLDALDKSGFNNMVRDRALAVWLILEAILAEHQCAAGTLKTIEAECLSSLVSRLPKTEVETILIELAAIRVVLLQAGQTPASIQGLQLRVRRRRIENTPGGKYRYVKILDDRIRRSSSTCSHRHAVDLDLTDAAWPTETYAAKETGSTS